MFYYITYFLAVLFFMCILMVLVSGLLKLVKPSRPGLMPANYDHNRYIKRHLLMQKHIDYYKKPRPQEEQVNAIKDFSRSIPEFDNQMGGNGDDDE
jgi:hypothetical protein